MDAILRISNQTGIRDFDLTQEKQPIEALQLTFFPTEGEWSYQCPETVLVNGRGSSSGLVRLWDVYLVDQATRTKVLVLPKTAGEKKKLLFSGELSVGRAEGNRLKLVDPTVSGRHCVFFLQGGVLFVKDQRSTNGTWVNDRPATPGTLWRLEQGDTVKVGRYVFGVEEALSLLNMDDGALFCGGADGGQGQASRSAASDGMAARGKKPYPWFSRAPRMIRPLPALDVTVEDAPGIGQKPSMGMMALAMSIPAMALSFGMSALRYGLGRKKYGKLEKQRAELYTRYLTGVENQLTEHAKRQREQSVRMHPALKDCLTLAEGPAMSLWERHPGDEDFLSLRLGTGRQPAKAQIRTQPRRLQLAEDEFTHLPEQLAEKYRLVEDMPLCCELFRDGVCGVIGPRKEAVELALSMAAQIAALHSYEDVKLVVVFPKEEWQFFSWMRWLPHCASAERDIRTIACTEEEAKEFLPSLEAVIRERLDSRKEWSFAEKTSTLPHYIFLVADPSLLAGSPAVGSAMMANQPELGLNGIILGQSLSDFPHSVHNVLRVSRNGKGLHISMTQNSEPLEFDTAESAVPLPLYRTFARKMAPIRLAGSGSGRQGLPSLVTLFEGLHIRKVEELALEEYWAGARPEETMSVPIGIKGGGDAFLFDIHEGAQGPHGLVAGGTGSGKSKMVQAWVASMAIQFSPEDVNFILVDFKGESLVAPFRSLPHLAGFTSNIDPDVRRKFLAIESEMSRRMLLLKTGGDRPYDDIIAYRRARRKDPGMEPMPFLFLVVDEFAAFKDQYPEFISPIDHLYQAGRSLGMMAILMTQKPTGKITAQMDANMGFSWCLQVKEEGDSREVIGNADAAHLRVKGRAYVKAKDGTYELIQSYFGQAPYMPDEKSGKSSAQVFALKLNGLAMEGMEEASPEGKNDRPDEITVLSHHIARLCDRRGIPHARPIWWEPLGDHVDLEALEQRLTRKEGEAAGAVTGPRAVLGLFDDPAHQIQDVFTYDFWKKGNLAVYGTSLSGKTTFLQTLLVSLCLRYHPDEVQFYLLEQGSYQLRALEDFPHVGGSAGGDDPDSMDQVMKFLTGELERRKKKFHRLGVGSPAGYAERTGAMAANIFLLADHVNLLGDAFYEFMDRLVRLAVEGPAYGIYTVCGFSGTIGINSRLRQAVKESVALRLSDRIAYSDLVGKVTENPDGLVMGRGYIQSGKAALLFQTAIFAAEDTDGNRALRLKRLAKELKESWKGPLPVPIRTIPEEIPYGTLSGAPYLLGLEYENGTAVCLRAPRCSLMVSAGTKEALSSLYRSLCRQALEAEGEVWLCTEQAEAYEDLLDGGHLFSEMGDLDRLIPELRKQLQGRQDGYAKNPQADFPPILLLVDNMKTLITTGKDETTGRLEAFVRLCGELGFTLVCGGDAMSMNHCRYSSGSLLAVTMREGDRMIVGGNLVEHQLFDTASFRLKHQKPLAPDEAYLLSGEGETPVHIKLMRGDNDE